MRRISGGKARANWQELVQKSGLPYIFTDAPDGGRFSYWSETDYYELNQTDRYELEDAGKAIMDMLVEAGDYLLGTPDNLYGAGGADDLRKMRIPEWMWPEILRTWNLDPARGRGYGRCDLRYAGSSPHGGGPSDPKLFEFNADTPTSLPESSYVQAQWFEATRQGSAQYNDIYPRLVAAWTRNMELLEADLGFKPVVTFACSNVDDSGEDELNTIIQQGCCEEAGYETHLMYMEDIVCGLDGRFYDNLGRHIDVIFKLHPWEYFRDARFGQAAFADMGRTVVDAPAGGYASFGGAHAGRQAGTVWIEPPYKMLWSNKGILPVLWKLFGGDPVRSCYLLESYFEDEQPAGFTDYVRKPMLGREGANLTFVRGRGTGLSTDGAYTGDGYVVQRTCELPDFADRDGSHHPVIGLWVIDGEPAGIGIRESSGLVTDNLSRFVPHVIA